jgi:hypothetical protein
MVSFEPDGVLYAHSQLDLTDLRIVDSAGQQIPWRAAPPAIDVPAAPLVRLLNSGTRGNRAVALLDLGRDPGVHDQIVLDVPDRDFVGRVEVRGSDNRDGSFTFLSTTVIYDVSGAPPARSTTAVYPASDFRFLSLSATGVSAITGASVLPGAPGRPELATRDLRSFSVRTAGRASVAVADLGYRNVPVDELRIRAATDLYDRPVVVEGSNSGGSWVVLAQGRVFRFQGSVETTIPLLAHHRYLRLTIENGDDAPLEGLRIQVLARPRTVLVAPGFQPPYRLLYGNPGLAPPEYDFAQAPLDTEELAAVPPAELGREALNPDWEPEEDTRSFFARHPAVLTAALALAAVVLFFGAFLALRRRTERMADG